MFETSLRFDALTGNGFMISIGPELTSLCLAITLPNLSPQVDLSVCASSPDLLHMHLALASKH